MRVDRWQIVRDAAALAQQVADRGPVRVEVEVRRKVIRGQVVEASSPASTSCITWAATIAFVVLAIEN